MRFLDGVSQDLRLAFRMFRGSSGFAAVAVATILLGIGANVAIFSVVHAVLLKPLPYSNPGRLISISERQISSPGVDRLSFADAREILRRARTVDAVVLYRDASAHMQVNGETEVLRGQRVSANFFDALGVRPALGRFFTADQRLPGRNGVMVITTALWERRFGANPAILERPVAISGEQIRIVGVLPPDFQPFHMSNPGEVPEFFRPYAVDDLESNDRGLGGTAIARMRDGVAVAQARAELNTILRELMREYPNAYSHDTAFDVQSLDHRLTGNVRTILWVLLGATGFVLLIMCANVANLMLVRGNARSTELAIRTALGCGWWRLARQLLVESVALSLMGGCGGVLLAWAGVTALVAIAPPEIPRVHEIGIDTSVLLFALLASLGTGAIFCVAPAIRAARLDLNSFLKGARGQDRDDSAPLARNALIVVEIACAFVLTLGAGLLGRSVRELVSVNPGYDPHNVLTMTAFIYDNTDEARLRHYRNILDRVRAIPGIESAAMVSTLPLSQAVQDTIYVEGMPQPNHADAPVVDQYFATPDYFRVMKIPLERGRVFDDRDGRHTLPVAILSASCARVLFGDQDPIGRRIRTGDGHEDWITIVGIVGDVWQHGMDAGPGAGVYIPQSQRPDFYYRLAARTSGDPWRFFPAVRAAMREIDPSQPMFHVQPMDAYVTKSLADRIFALSLIGLLDSLALALAAVGMYGVISYAVSLRTRELGIRMALGADASAVVRLVMRDVMVLLACGVAAGGVLAWPLTRFLSHLLYGIGARDSATAMGAAAVLGCIALVAGFIPGLRAASVSPSEALR